MSDDEYDKNQIRRPGLFVYTEWVVVTQWGDGTEQAVVFESPEEAQRQFDREQLKHREQDYRPLPTVLLQCDTSSIVTLREAHLERYSEAEADR